MAFLHLVDGGDCKLSGVEECESCALFEVLLVAVAECFRDDALVPNRRAMGLVASAAEKLGGDLCFSETAAVVPDRGFVML